MLTPGVGPSPRLKRMELGEALPFLIEPLRGKSSEVNPLHFISVAREVCKLMHIVGTSFGKFTKSVANQL